MLLLVTVLLFALVCSTSASRLEPFDYERCRDRGFDRQFCTVTPLPYVGPGQCWCPDTREVGRYTASYGAKCDCN